MAIIGTRSKLQSVETARAVAAILVVVYHAARHVASNSGYLPFGSFSKFGHAGVDFFFVLSGFIILYIHHGDIGLPERLGHYAQRRATRTGLLTVPAALAALGRSSYAIYLFNFLTIAALWQGLIFAGRSTRISPEVTYLCLVAASIIDEMVIERIVEQPVIGLVRQRIEPTCRAIQGRRQIKEALEPRAEPPLTGGVPFTNLKLIGRPGEARRCPRRSKLIGEDQRAAGIGEPP